MRNRGVFITLEGIDGAGKSTHVRLVVARLRRLGYPVTATREPGGTRLGEQIRRLLLDPRTHKLGSLAELALMYAARAQHLEEVVRPALARNRVVVSDRFNDASLAYQGLGRKLGVATVLAFDEVVCGSTQPDLTLVLDLDPRVALARTRRRSARGNADGGRFEAQGLGFHQRVRAGYLALARRAPQRIKVVNAGRKVDEVQADIRKFVLQLLARKRRRR